MLGQAACLIIGKAAAEAEILLHEDLVAAVKTGETNEVRRLRPHGPRRVRPRPAIRRAAAADRALRAGGLPRLSPGRASCDAARHGTLAQRIPGRGGAAHPDAALRPAGLHGEP